jgi:hypothetical protein
MKPWKNTSEIPKPVPVEVPDGISGPWEVYSYTISKADEEFQHLRGMFSNDRGRYVPAGTYKGLKRGRHIIMSNTPDEIRDCREFFREAQGRVLINGLGLGIVLDVILHKLDPESKELAVTEVFVIEKSEDVLHLVGPTFLKDKRVHLIHGDAYTFKAPPGPYFDAVWHDIFDDICAENLKGMHKLHRKYGRKTKWQGSWCRELCEYHRR